MPKFDEQTKIKIFGKNYDNTNITALRKELNIKKGSVKESNDVARYVRNNIKNEKVIYNATTGVVDKINLTDKPLLIRNFLEIKKINSELRNNILTNEPFYAKNKHDENILIYNKSVEFENNDIANFNVMINFFISVSDVDFGDVSSRRSINFEYKGMFGELTTALNTHIKFLKKRKQTGIFSKKENAELIDKYDNNIDFSGVNNKFEFEELIKGRKSAEVIHQSDFLKRIINHLKSTNYKNMQIFIYDIIPQTFYTSTIYDIRKMKLREVKYDNLSINIFNNIIDVKNDGINCVISYLQKKYKKINVHDFFNNKKYDDGITTDDVIDFCKKYNIKCIVYDRESNITARYTPEQATYEPLYYIAFNNHIYPLKTKKPAHKKNTVTDYYDDNINVNFENLIKNNIIPGDVEMCHSKKKMCIASFINNGIRHHNNNDYTRCLNILSLFGFEEHMTHKINKYNIFNTLTKLYNIPSYNSFFPFFNNYTVGGFMYYNDNVNIDNCKIITRDKNKAYGHALYTLEHIYTTDFKYDKIIKVEDGDIIEININNIYIIEPYESTILCPNAGYYTGDDLLYFDNNDVKYKIKYEIEAHTHDNKFKSLINDYYTKTKKIINNRDDENFIKDIINIFIGTLEKGERVTTKTNYTKICNADEATKSGHKYIILNNDAYACYNTINDYKTDTQKFITIQIKNRCRRMIYEEMVRLKLKSDQIIQIHTDAITYAINKGDNIDTTNIDDNDFKKWKIQKESKKINDDDNDEVLFESINIEDLIKNNYNENYLNRNYAGAGKTTRIIKKLIPAINNKTIYNDTKQYIILTPSHTSLSRYRKLNENCDVIQKYIYDKIKFPHNIKIVIVDEVGMCNSDEINFLYKLSKMGIKLYCYGDFNQLPPINKNKIYDCTQVSHTFLAFMFKKIVYSTHNYRNTFSLSYYDKLINDEIDLIKEIDKYSSKNYLFEAEYIICYRNKTVDKYNNIMMKFNDYKLTSPGCRVICKTNNLRKYDIYNGYILNVVETDKTHIILKDNVTTYKIPLIFYNKKAGNKPYFKPAYALTIHSLQGASIKSYYCPPDDYYFLNNPNTAYTIISRIQNK